MPRARASDAPKIRRTLALYRILAYTTGVFLLILVVEMVLKYGFALELQAGPEGLGFAPRDQVTGVNISYFIQIAHGYIYLAYLVIGFVLTTYLRWPLTRFLVIAAGGVVPLLSFVTARRVHRQARQELDAIEAGAPDPAPTRQETPAP